MEINVTKFVNDSDSMIEFSASQAELGYDAGRYTWNNALEHVDDDLLCEDIAALDSWLDGFGAWDEEDRAEWSVEDYNALLLQFIAGDIREMEAYDSFEEYSEVAGGNLHPSDDGEWYYNISH